MSDFPKVSVIMKVYNGEKYLREAIDSVLNQTFGDFELLILDDGSKDSSAEIVKSYTDSRIRLIQNAENEGIVAGQNRLISEAKGEYIAVLDCDDISYPERLEKQVTFLDKHTSYIMCASFRDEIKDGEYTQDIRVRKLSYPSLKFGLCFINPVTHSSVMFRSKMYRDFGICYGPEPVAEDYGVITDMAVRRPIAILPERLVAYRIVSGSVSNTRGEEMEKAAVDVRSRYLDRIDVSDEAKDCLKGFYKRELHALDTKALLEAMKELAEAVKADILRGGNAFSFAEAVIKEYILTVNDYSMSMWKELRRSEYRHLTSIKGELGKLLLGACMLHHKRK